MKCTAPCFNDIFPKINLILRPITLLNEIRAAIMRWLIPYSFLCYRDIFRLHKPNINLLQTLSNTDIIWWVSVTYCVV